MTDGTIVFADGGEETLCTTYRVERRTNGLEGPKAQPVLHVEDL